MVKKWIILFLLATISAATHAQYVSPNNDEIQKLKELTAANRSARAQFGKLQADADSALLDTPHPKDVLHSEGRLQGDPEKTATWQALRDIHKMYALAMVYRITNAKKYLDKSVLFLTAWAENNKPNGDPIDDTNLDPAVEAYDLIKAGLTPAQDKLISTWLAATAQREISKFDPKRQTGYNNWHSHRLKEVGEIGFAIGNKNFQDWAVDGLKTQIGKNLQPDGTSIDFKLRDAMHYHIYDVEPLLKLSIIIKRANGTNYYTYLSPQQTSIQKSVEWMLPYMTGKQTHPEFVNSTVSFDRRRAANGEKGYKPGTLFKPQNGLGVFYLAEYFYPDAINIIQKVSGHTDSYLNWQLVLNQVMR